MAKKILKQISRKKICVFKIKNRRGYAALCLGNLTEGSTPARAVARLKYPLRRMGFELSN